MSDKTTKTSPADKTPAADEITALLDAQSALIAEQQAQIESLQQENLALRAGRPILVVASAAPQVQIGDSTYQVVHSLRVQTPAGARVMKAAEIAADPDLCAELLANGSTAIAKI